MWTRTFIGGFVGIALIAVLLGLGIYAYDNIVITGAPQTGAGAPPAISAFIVVKPNFVVDGSNLAKVEVWAVPTDTASGLSDFTKLGDASLQAGGDSATQIWTLQIPSVPVSVSRIFARGFDANGALADETFLPYAGPTQLYDAIWSVSEEEAAGSSSAETPRSTTFTLHVGETGKLGGTSLKLLGIESDSRCPRTAVCIWAGEVEAQVELSSGSEGRTTTLHSNGAPYDFMDEQASMIGVSPARGNTPPAQGDYQITFALQRL